MPKDRPALAAAEIQLIRDWIVQGAKDDSAAHAAPAIRRRDTARSIRASR